MASLDSTAVPPVALDVNPYALGLQAADWDNEEQASLLQGLSDGLQALGTMAARFQVEHLIQQLDGRADYLLELLAEYAADHAGPAPVILEGAWQKARGITPGEPITDELSVEWQDPAVRTQEWAEAYGVKPRPDAPMPDGDPSRWWPHGDQVPPFDPRPEAHRFEGQESAVDLLRSARGWGSDGSAEEAGK